MIIYLVWRETTSMPMLIGAWERQEDAYRVAYESMRDRGSHFVQPVEYWPDTKGNKSGIERLYEREM